MSDVRHDDTALYDVVAVNIRTGVQRVMATNKSAANADAFISLAVVRLGVDEEFYQAAPHVLSHG